MKIRNVVCIALCAVLVPVYVSAGLLQNQKQADQTRVKKQSAEDIARKEEILAKMRAYMNDINGRLGKNSKTKLDIPVNPDAIDDVSDKQQSHTSKPIPPKVFANVLTAGPLYSEADIRSKTVGAVSLNEKVEIVLQVQEEDNVNGHKGRWVLVRRTNTDEGWLFSTAFEKPVPSGQPVPAETTGSSKKFAVPTEGRVSSKFGWRVDPVSKKPGQFHGGIDIACPTGTPIKAAADGDVRVSEFNNGGYGNFIVIQHEKDLATYYGHMSARNVSQGAKVKKGQLIGAVGATGYVTGPHLHFEVRKSDKCVDPDAYMP